MEICDRSKCTACSACMNICPRKCINMDFDSIGNHILHVDESTCIKCGKCIEICPVNKMTTSQLSVAAYAGWSNDATRRKVSSSGGVATVIASNYLKSGGVVYGAISVDSRVIHGRIVKDTDLARMKGSKYVRSRIDYIFTLVKKDLASRNPVVFIGTPCQVSGLRSYLGRDYDNLLTVDLICHGAPSERYLYDHIEHQIGCVDWDNISFRNEFGYSFIIKKNENTLYKKSLYRDLYYVGFMKSLILHDSCYQCPYAKHERVSDITIGDFWGLGKNTPFPYDISNGVSLLLVNTEKGSRVLKACENELELHERSLPEAWNGNPNLNNPNIAHKNTERFRKLYQSHGFETAAKKCLRIQMIKYLIISLLQR